MKIEIISHQKQKKIDLKRLRRHSVRICTFLASRNTQIARKFRSAQSLSIVLCGRHKMAAMNRAYLRHRGSTDVISFPLWEPKDPECLGEVVVSLAQAIACAGRLGIPWEEELLRYITHGILHLLGYGDARPQARAAMEKLQEEALRKALGV